MSLDHIKQKHSIAFRKYSRKIIVNAVFNVNAIISKIFLTINDNFNLTIYTILNFLCPISRMIAKCVILYLLDAR